MLPWMSAAFDEASPFQVFPVSTSSHQKPAAPAPAAVRAVVSAFAAVCQP